VFYPTGREFKSVFTSGPVSLGPVLLFQVIRFNRPAAKFDLVWYSPPFSSAVEKVSQQNILFRIAELSCLAGASEKEGIKEGGF
jgi:hypothetical protein